MCFKRIFIQTLLITLLVFITVNILPGGTKCSTIKIEMSRFKWK